MGARPVIAQESLAAARYLAVRPDFGRGTGGPGALDRRRHPPGLGAEDLPATNDAQFSRAELSHETYATLSPALGEADIDFDSPKKGRLPAWTVRGYSITRAEADRLHAAGFPGIHRFSTRGPDTTGLQGWVIRALPDGTLPEDYWLRLNYVTGQRIPPDPDIVALVEAIVKGRDRLQFSIDPPPPGRRAQNMPWKVRVLRRGRDQQPGLYSRGGKPSGLTVAALQDALVSQFGKGISRLIQDGTLHIVQSLADLPEGIRAYARGDEEGAYWQGQAWIVADNTTLAKARGVLLHELGEHFGLKAMLGAKAYTELQGRINTLYRVGNARVKQAWDRVLREYRDENGKLLFPEGSEKHIAEVIANLGENNVFGKSEWWKALLARIKAFLIARGFHGLVKTLTDADLNALLVASVRAAQRTAGPRFSGGVGRDDLAGFARQFGVDPEQLRREFEAVAVRYLGSMAAYDALPAAAGKNGLKAPNGQPTKLNKQQWVMVRTPRFKAWFGDWETNPAQASQVVDENGEPLAVHHGTMENFTEFNTKAKAHLGKLDTKLGSHFAKSPKISDTFAGGAYAVASDYYVDAYTPENSWYRDRYGDLKFDGLFGYRGGWNDPIVPYDPAEHGELRKLTNEGRIVMLRPNGNVLSVFLNIKKPVDAMSLDKDAWDETEVEKAVAQAILPTHPEIFREYIMPEVIDGEAVLAQLQAGQAPITQGKYSYPDIGAFVADYHAMNYVPAEVVKAALRDEGFDGVIYNNTSKQEINNTDQSQRQSYIIFEPEQAKSATGNSGEFNPENPDIRHARPAGVFYSELAQQIGQVKAAKAPPAQWKAIINGLKQKGVKQDEIDWSGVLDWLSLAQGPVAREQVQAFVEGNGVRVADIFVGEPNREKMRLAKKELSGYGYTVKNTQDQVFLLDAGGNRVGNFFTLPEAVQVAFKRFIDAVTAGEKRYSQWQLPGGENYKELLITLPRQTPKAMTYQEWVAAGKPGEWSSQGTQQAKTLFQSSHFDEPNILAHIRFNDRTDAEGRKVLFLEEIQSDWGQTLTKRTLA